MKTLTKTISIFTLISLAAFVAMPALAAEVNLEGTGLLFAKGEGEAIISGDIAFFKVSGSGEVIITDYSGDAIVRSKGFGEVEKPDTGTEPRVWRYEGTGTVVAKGSNLSIKVEGKNLRLAVKGTGTAYLEGEGMYRIK